MQALILALTIISADPNDDMKNVHQRGLPFASMWAQYPADDYFSTDWHLALAKKQRFMPTFKLLGFDEAALTSQWEPAIRDYGATGLPIGLVGDNWAFFVMANDKTAKVQIATGDGPYCDPYGSTLPWSNWSTKRFTSRRAKQLQSLIPSPAWIEDADNNEAGMWNWFMKEEGSAPTVARTTTDKTKFIDGAPPFRWTSPDNVRKQNIRLDEWIVAHGGYGADPYLAWPDFTKAYVEKYKAYNDAAVAASPPGWSNRYSAGYSTWAAGLPVQPKFVFDAIGTGLHEVQAYDATGPSPYLNQTTSNVRAIGGLALRPTQQKVWEDARARNPRAYREIWVSFNLFGLLYGARAGTYEVLTPERVSGWCEYLLWLSRASNGGVAVNLRYWDNYNTKRSELMFRDPNEQPVPNETDAQKKDRLTRIGWATVAYADLDRFGYPELKTSTIEDYLMASIKPVDKICDNPTLRDFWMRGTTMPVTIKDMDKFGYVLVKLDARYMIYAWTPMKLTSEVAATPIGPVTIPFNGATSVYLIGTPPTSTYVWSPLN